MFWGRFFIEKIYIVIINYLLMRTFTIQGSGIKYFGGRYKTDDVQKAAKRAASQLFRKLKKTEYKMYKSKLNIKFILRETTKGSKKKTFYYIAERIPLSKPVSVQITNVSSTSVQTITYNYKIIVKKCSEIDVNREI